MRLFVSVREDGTIVHSSPGVTVSKFSIPPNGDYNVQFPQAVTNCVPVATIGETSGNALPTGFIAARTEGTAVPLDANGVEVLTRDSAGAFANLPWNLIVAC